MRCLKSDKRLPSRFLAKNQRTRLKVLDRDNNAGIFSAFGTMHVCQEVKV